MQQIPEVETAKTLLNEAMSWSVLKWLREKKRVRKTADLANAALDQLNLALKNRWPVEVRNAYDSLNGNAKATKIAPRSPLKVQPIPADSDLWLVVKKVKEADDEAHRARMDAETTFDNAEKQLSTALAREGCRKAIHSWDLHEKAIRKAEAVIRPD